MEVDLELREGPVAPQVAQIPLAVVISTPKMSNSWPAIAFPSSAFTIACSVGEEIVELCGARGTTKT